MKKAILLLIIFILIISGCSNTKVNTSSKSVVSTSVNDSQSISNSFSDSVNSASSIFQITSHSFSKSTKSNSKSITSSSASFISRSTASIQNNYTYPSVFENNIDTAWYKNTFSLMYKEFIYYNFNGTIYRIRPDGKDKSTVLTNSDVLYFDIYNGYIFYTSKNELWRLKLGTTEKTKLAEDEFVTGIKAYKDFVFYFNKNGDFIRIKNDGKDKTILGDKTPANTENLNGLIWYDIVNFDDDYIYYANKTFLYKVKYNELTNPELPKPIVTLPYNPYSITDISTDRDYIYVAINSNVNNISYIFRINKFDNKYTEIYHTLDRCSVTAGKNSYLITTKNYSFSVPHGEIPNSSNEKYFNFFEPYNIFNFTDDTVFTVGKFTADNSFFLIKNTLIDIKPNNQTPYMIIDKIKSAQVQKAVT